MGVQLIGIPGTWGILLGGMMTPFRTSRLLTVLCYACYAALCVCVYGVRTCMLGVCMYACVCGEDLRAVETLETIGRG